MTRLEFLAANDVNLTAKDAENFCPSDFGLPNDTQYCDDGCDCGRSCWHSQMSMEDVAEAEAAMKDPYIKEVIATFKANHPSPLMTPDKKSQEDPEVVNPSHYNFSPYKPIKVIRAWGLNFNLGSVVKYVVRAGKKDPSKHIQDLEKALFYLQDEIDELKHEMEESA